MCVKLTTAIRPSYNVILKNMTSETRKYYYVLQYLKLKQDRFTPFRLGNTVLNEQKNTFNKKNSMKNIRPTFSTVIGFPTTIVMAFLYGTIP